MSFTPHQPDKSSNKSIYVVTILNSDSKSKYMYIKTLNNYFNIYEHYLDIRGVVISKAEADKLKTNKNDRELEGDTIHIMVPHHQWIKTENISFNGFAK